MLAGRSSLLDRAFLMRRLLEIPQVYATAIGFPQTDGVSRSEFALLAYVDRKRPLASLSPLHRLPRTWRGSNGASIPIDVVEMDGPSAAMSLLPGGNPEYARRVRPMHPGYSFGLANRAGTLGLIVWPEAGPPRPLILSSSHVLNLRPNGHIYPLYQPAGFDGGPHDKPVARALRYTRLHARIPNHTEAGLAEPLRPEDVSPRHPLGAINAVCSGLKLGQRLRKVGRTTGLVTGKVVALDWTGWIRFGRQRYPFANQVLIFNESCPISLDGDSGSVWLSETCEAAAMNFAGCRSGSGSISTPLSTIFRRLSVRLAMSAEEA